jgi:hypothetical protein
MANDNKHLHKFGETLAKIAVARVRMRISEKIAGPHEITSYVYNNAVKFHIEIKVNELTYPTPELDVIFDVPSDESWYEYTKKFVLDFSDYVIFDYLKVKGIKYES